MLPLFVISRCEVKCRGLHLVRELADDLTIEGNAHGGTTVRVRWRSLGARREHDGRA